MGFPPSRRGEKGIRVVELEIRMERGEQEDVSCEVSGML